MYPLNMALLSGIGFAVANDEAEHQALTACGYGPAYAAKDSAEDAADQSGHTVETARAALDAAGIAYDKRLGLSKLLALLPA